MKRVAAVLLLACSCSAPPPQLRCEIGLPGTAPFAIGNVGEPVTLTLSLPRTCNDPSLVRAEVSVLDGSGDSHEASSVVVAGGVDDIHADVTFVPDRPGRWHVTVRFWPNLGLTQGDVEVPADRRDGGVLLPRSFDTCPKIDFMRDGRPVCLDGGTVLGDDVQWTLAGERFVEAGDGGWRREPDVSLGLAGTLLAGPTANDVLLLQAGGPMRLVTYTDGGLIIEDLLEPVQAADLGRAWWRRGRRAITNVLSEGGACTDNADSGFLRCAVASNRAAAEPAGLWTFAPTSLTGGLSIVRLDEGYPTTRDAFDLPANFSAGLDVGPWNTGLSIRLQPFSGSSDFQDYAITWRAGAFVLGRFTDPNEQTHSSTGEWLIRKEPGGGLRAYRK